ncbi:MAG: hypothetical protein LC734_02510, partial [Acidobacteria bacterium]|nr:hypothetical protein [Acidobacteriota bacterium]
MKYTGIVVIILLLIGAAAGQKAKRPPTKKFSGKVSKTAKPAPAPVLDEKTEFEKAAAVEVAADRVPALKKFLVKFPESERRAETVELIASSRILVAEEKRASGDLAGAATLYKLAIEEGPQNFSDDFFRESIAGIPAALYWRGARDHAFELARIIEKRVGANAAQLARLTEFYLGIEDGAGALRIGQAAVAAAPDSEVGYRSVALAHRINFNLDESAKAAAKAFELAPASAAAKIGLADMQRALGLSGEAIILYRELLEKNEADLPARTGLVLALFEAGKKSDAEVELARAIEKTPGNVVLLAGAGNWYATQGDGSKAVELARKAIEKEPRYIWSHIALGRGLMSLQKPVDAEQALIAARKYGNFPTLEYEIARSRAMAGFYKDVVDDLKKSFAIDETGSLQTKLGGRIERRSQTFAELLAAERSASTFAPAMADDQAAGHLKRLLDLEQKLNQATIDAELAAAAADEFAAGTDNMKSHRQLFAAAALVQKKIALDKALELT